jgi:hypothetical protein
MKQLAICEKCGATAPLAKAKRQWALVVTLYMKDGTVRRQSRCDKCGPMLAITRPETDIAQLKEAK